MGNPELILKGNSSQLQNLPGLQDTIKHIKQIKNANASTTADLLTVNQGITIQKSQLGGGSPIIRGFEANRVLLVVPSISLQTNIEGTFIYTLEDRHLIDGKIHGIAKQKKVRFIIRMFQKKIIKKHPRIVVEGMDTENKIIKKNTLIIYW